MNLFRKLFSFDGRIRRRDWWVFSLGLFAFETLLVKVIELAVDGVSFELARGNVLTWLVSDAVSETMFAIQAAIMIALIWPNLAVTTKRAHDRDTNGVWMNAVLLVSYATFFLPAGLMQRSGAALDRGDWVGGLPLVGETVLGFVIVSTVVFLGFLDGTPGANRYGASPKTGSKADLAEVFD